MLFSSKDWGCKRSQVGLLESTYILGMSETAVLILLAGAYSCVKMVLLSYSLIHLPLCPLLPILLKSTRSNLRFPCKSLCFL
jgi:hypothetical protein